MAAFENSFHNCTIDIKRNNESEIEWWRIDCYTPDAWSYITVEIKTGFNFKMFAD